MSNRKLIVRIIKRFPIAAVIKENVITGFNVRKPTEIDSKDVVAINAPSVSGMVSTGVVYGCENIVEG